MPYIKIINCVQDMQLKAVVFYSAKRHRSCHDAARTFLFVKCLLLPLPSFNVMLFYTETINN